MTIMFIIRNNHQINIIFIEFSQQLLRRIVLLQQINVLLKTSTKFIEQRNKIKSQNFSNTNC